jgi:hypothetical protein
VLIVSPATALWNQRYAIANARERIKRLSAAIARTSDFSLYQWAQIMAFVLEFRPDTIVELGRLKGNSTCCFLETANLLGGRHACRFLSLDLVDCWSKETVPSIQSIIPQGWFEPGEIVVGDILSYDFCPILNQSKRCAIFWDAHGIEIADCVLGKLLPQLKNKSHLVIMHDVSDNRYPPIEPEYGSASLWRGENATTDYFWLGHIVSSVAQTISVLDFISRNRIPFHSAAEDLYLDFSKNKERVQILRQLLGDDLFSSYGHAWYWFTLNEALGSVTFPRLPPEQNRERTISAGPSDSRVEELEQLRRENQRLQQTIGLIEGSLAWRAAERWRRIKNRLVPRDTKRDALYKFVRRSILGKQQ